MNWSGPTDFSPLSARTGIFGGTFDPPHIGHLILAAEAAAQLNLTQVRWVLTPNPPHKLDYPISPLADRLALLQAALAGNPLFTLSTVEIDRPPPHYAADTLEQLCAAEPGGRWVYLMGEDSLRDLPHWHAPQRFVAACYALGVMRRPGRPADLAALEPLLPGVSAKVRWVEAPLLDLAATDIRTLIRRSDPTRWRYYVLPAVYREILQRGLYRFERG